MCVAFESATQKGNEKSETDRLLRTTELTPVRYNLFLYARLFPVSTLKDKTRQGAQQDKAEICDGAR